MFCISNKSREGQTVFPLFVNETTGLFQRNTGENGRLNIGEKFAKELGDLLSAGNMTLKSRKLSANDATQTLYYIYAILYSQTYRARYEDLLKMDYPRVPLPTEPALFHALAGLGGELAAFHLLVSPKLSQFFTTCIDAANAEVEKVSYARDTVWLDKTQSRGFGGVTEDVWNFHIGGYQVCEKWLKDRKGRTLSKDDISHYQKIIVALSETIRIMREIDEVIEKHGGWPTAFQSS